MTEVKLYQVFKYELCGVNHRDTGVTKDTFYDFFFFMNVCLKKNVLLRPADMIKQYD